MNKAEIITTLRDHQVELREAGVLHLALFGSVARNEAGEASDIDLVADFDDAKRLSLIGVIGIKHRLEDIPGGEVDLAQTKNLRPSVRERALREASLPFREPLSSSKTFWTQLIPSRGLYQVPDTIRSGEIQRQSRRGSAS